MITSTAIAPTTTDWITALATVVAALGGLAGFSALYLEVRRSRGARLRPPEGLLTALQDFSEVFSEITAHGGQESFFFLDRRRQRTELMLITVSGQISDRELETHLVKVRATYIVAWAHAPGNGTLNDTENADRVNDQLTAATEGQQATTKAIERANTLIREHPL